MIKAIIFDLDGTLLDTLEGLKDSTNCALSKFGYKPKNFEEIRSYVGNGVEKLIKRAIPDGEENPNFKECLNTFKSDYSKTMYEKTRPYAGINELLDTLKQKGIKIGVVSNKYDTAVKELCERYFDSLIDIAVGECANIKPKPCCDGIFKAMEFLGVDKNQTLYVGDSEVDVQTAANAGIQFIGVSWGFRAKSVLIADGAENIIDEPSELLKFLQ